MEEPFDPALFVSMMRKGAFDGRLSQELANLSREQLEAVAILLSRRDNPVTPPNSSRR